MTWITLLLICSPQPPSDEAHEAAVPGRLSSDAGGRAAAALGMTDLVEEAGEYFLHPHPHHRRRLHKGAAGEKDGCWKRVDSERLVVE